MDRNHTTAEGLTIWASCRIATGTLNPADLYRTILAALRDAEARGEQRGERRPAWPHRPIPCRSRLGR